MLGPVDLVAASPWMVSGKHPVAPDFLRLGGKNALFDGLAGWLTKGYQIWLGRQGKGDVRQCYLFWCQGSNNDELLTGLIKSSCDSLGRPFPLLVAGFCNIKGWRKRWWELPYTLEGCWQAVQQAVSFIPLDLAQFQESLGRLQLPDCEMQADPLLASCKGRLPIFQRVRKEELANRCLGIELLGEMTDEQARACYHFSLGQLPGGIPLALFVGSGANSCLYFTEKPLNNEDFYKLWTWPNQGP